ncbi:hypothetical protein IWW50_001307 [Coemansia erecta]|nr:hypothetical protein IWW50_001307 [Coemansia erecta]
MKYSLLAIALQSTALLAYPASQKCAPVASPDTVATGVNMLSAIVAAAEGTPSALEDLTTDLELEEMPEIVSEAMTGIVPAVSQFLETRATAAASTANIPSGAQKEVSIQGQDTLSVFAAYSGAAYTVSDSWNCRFACQHPGTEDTVIEHHWDIGFPPSAGYIARNPSGRFIVVAFRGTGETSQWADNVNIVQVPWPDEISGSRVHAGFLRGYTSVQSDVLSKLKSLATQYPDYSIAIVGHSLGGARAALCFLDVSVKMPELMPRVYMYTQGQPRTGNKNFADAIDALSAPKYRGVYEYDVAPRLPPTIMGYHHHSTEAWYHNNDTLLCLQPTVDDGCAGNGDILHPLSIDDHFGYPGLKYE